MAAVLMQRVLDPGEEQMRTGKEQDSNQLVAGVAR
jgi:hypothetical protein